MKLTTKRKGESIRTNNVHVTTGWPDQEIAGDVEAVHVNGWIWLHPDGWDWLIAVLRDKGAGEARQQLADELQDLIDGEEM
uniref:Uncharacterized protein n=1 Tax=viral metagenome TaxID=1070528 RepID=A0A6M3LML4_9ZZZZ